MQSLFKHTPAPETLNPASTAHAKPHLDVVVEVPGGALGDEQQHHVTPKPETQAAETLNHVRYIN